MAVKPELIKSLREKTGVGIGECKKALDQANGNLEEAISILRKAGIATAVKKEGRTANEGMIGIAETEQRIVLAEINAETDFVVKNERFQQFLTDIVDEIAATNPSSLETFLSQKFSKDPSMTIEEYRTSIVQAIGEHILIRRLAVIPKEENASLGVYSHLGGKIVAVVEIAGSDAVSELAKEIAMQVAASSPEYVSPEDVPETVTEHEKEIARTQMQGKPEAIIENILKGKISKFFDEVCLTRQIYIKDDKLKIADLLAQHQKQLTIKRFWRWTVGQVG